jgi:hypothetical protein
MSDPKAPARSAEAKPEMVTASIAARRTLVVDGQAYGPGTQVQLSVEEHARLLAAGFLHDSRVVQIEPSMGPQFRGPVNGVVRPT